MSRPSPLERQKELADATALVGVTIFLWICLAASTLCLVALILAWANGGAGQMTVGQILDGMWNGAAR